MPKRYRRKPLPLETEKRRKPSQAFIDTDSQENPSAVFLYEFGSWDDVREVASWMYRNGVGDLPPDHPVRLLFDEVLKFSVHEVMNAPSKNRSESQA